MVKLFNHVVLFWETKSGDASPFRLSILLVSEREGLPRGCSVVCFPLSLSLYLSLYPSCSLLSLYEELPSKIY